jgi:pimeloyl-ACP methyl ester carboxylesterase
MPKIQNLVRWFRLFITAVVLLVLVLAVVGSKYQEFENSKDEKRFPQIGTLVQAGQIKLNIICQGNATKTTVILESAGGVPARGWGKVQPEVAKFARVCSYDRAGYGWSESGVESRTSRQEADELKALLQAAGEAGPYVLVGHAEGGFVVQMFASQYPDDVAGVVLVDASHPNMFRRALAVLSKKAADQFISRNTFLNSPWGKLFNMWTVRFGLARLVTPQEDELSQEINYLRWQEKSLGAFWNETDAFETSTHQVFTSRNLGDRPLIVLTAGKVDEGVYDSPTDAAAVQRFWVEGLQADLVQLSSRGEQIIVPESGPLIPMKRPDAVVDAVRKVWEQINP